MVNVINAEQLRQSFGLPELPTEQHLLQQKAALQRSLFQQAQKPELQKQEQQAIALRDKPNPRSTSWLSGLVGLGNTVAGRRDVRDAKQNIAANNQALSQSTAAIQEAKLKDARAQQEYAHGMQMGGLGMDYSKHLDTMDMRALEASLRAQTARRTKLNKGNNYGRPTDEFTVDGKPFKGIYDAQTNTFEVTSGDGFEAGQRLPNEQVHSMGEEGGKSIQERKSMTKASTQLKLMEEFRDITKDEWQAHSTALQLVPTSILQPLVQAGEASSLNSAVAGVNDWLNGKMRDPDSRLGKYAKFLPEQDAETKRNVRKGLEAFGAADAYLLNPFLQDETTGQVSDQDYRVFRDALLIQSGSSGELIHAAINRLMDQYEGNIRTNVEYLMQPGVGSYASYVAAKRIADKMGPPRDTRELGQGAEEQYTRDQARTADQQQVTADRDARVNAGPPPISPEMAALIEAARRGLPGAQEELDRVNAANGGRP